MFLFNDKNMFLMFFLFQNLPALQVVCDSIEQYTPMFWLAYTISRVLTFTVELVN